MILLYLAIIGMVRSADLTNETVDEAKVKSLSLQALDIVSQTEQNNSIWFDGIETWEPPEHIRKGCPWYIMGQDFDGRTVFVWEAGACNYIPFIVEGTGEDAVNFERHFSKWFWKIDQLCKSSDEEKAMYVVDAKGYNVTQLTYLSVVKQKLLLAREINNIDHCVANPTVINLTFASQLFLNLLKPLAGRFVGRAETFSKREKWEPYLKSKIPKDQLPPFYGGNKQDYKPLEI